MVGIAAPVGQGSRELQDIASEQELVPPGLAVCRLCLAATVKQARGAVAEPGWRARQKGVEPRSVCQYGDEWRGAIHIQA